MKGRPCLSMVLMLCALMMAAAQQALVSPQPAAMAAHAKYKNKFYVLGGLTTFNNGNPLKEKSTGQFFALDLSKPWQSQAPAWIRLPDGPNSAIPKAAISLDGKILMVFPGINMPGHRFLFESNTWVRSKIDETIGNLYMSPVTLQTDGTAIIVGGYSHSNITTDFNMIDTYSFTEDLIITRSRLPPYNVNTANYLQGRALYHSGWSTYLSKAVFYGGTNVERSRFEYPDNWVTLYDPATTQWEPLITSGINPPPGIVHQCMAITDDGKTLLTHGGNVRNDTYLSHLFILNLLTGVWTQGPPSFMARSLSTCTVAGDYFLVWGGAQDSSTGVVDQGKASTPVLIYQISTNTWVQEYQPSVEYLESVTTTPSSPSSSSLPPSPSSTMFTNPVTDSHKPSIGAIVGCLAGAIVIAAVAGFLVGRHKRKSGKNKWRQEGPDPTTSFHRQGQPHGATDPASIRMNNLQHGRSDSAHNYHNSRQFETDTEQYTNGADINHYPAPSSAYGPHRTLSPSTTIYPSQDPPAYEDDDTYIRNGGGRGNNDDMYAMLDVSSSGSMTAVSLDSSMTYPSWNTRVDAADVHAASGSVYRVPSARVANSALQPAPCNQSPPTTSPHSYLSPQLPSAAASRAVSNARHAHVSQRENPQALQYSAHDNRE